MPRQKVPIPLLDQCKNILTWEVMAIECAEELKDFERRIAFLIQQTSSSRVPVVFHLMSEILDIVMDNLCINPYNLNLLLMPNRVHLRLGLPHFFLDHWASRESELAKTIVQRSPSINSLDLTGCEIHMEALKYIITYLTELQTLTLNGTPCTDGVLEYVFKTCKKLLTLHMENNPLITDRAFQNFNQSHHFPICRKLMVLNIPNADWNVSTVATILRTFPYLEQLCHPFLMKGLDLLISRNMSEVIPPLISVLAFDYRNNPGDSLNQILIHCRELSELRILGGEETLKLLQLPLLSKLKNLNELIYMDDICPLSTDQVDKQDWDDNHLMKVLSECGSNLHFLSVTGSHQVLDIWDLGSNCPNLEYLCLYTTTITADKTDLLNEKTFQNITFLHIILNQYRGLPEYTDGLKGALLMLLQLCYNIDKF